MSSYLNNPARATNRKTREPFMVKKTDFKLVNGKIRPVTIEEPWGNISISPESFGQNKTGRSAARTRRASAKRRNQSRYKSLCKNK